MLMNLLYKSIPQVYVKWLKRFLENRQAKVRFGGKLSFSQCMRQGIPQGSVLSPLLFILYINNLAEILPTETVNVIYTDDVTHRSKVQVRSRCRCCSSLVQGMEAESERMQM